MPRVLDTSLTRLASRYKGHDRVIIAPMEVDFGKALAGVTALAAAFAALATATGAFDQMQRDEPALSASVFGLAVFAGVLVVGAGIVTDKTFEGVLVWTALIAFLVAAVIGVIILVRTQGNRTPPVIKVQFKGDPTLALDGTISVDELSSTESLKVSVLGQKPPGNAGTGSGSPTEDTFLKAALGAGASGDLDLPLNVQIPASTYRWVTVLAWVDDKPADCFASVPPDKFKKTPGCVIMRVPGGP